MLLTTRHRPFGGLAALLVACSTPTTETAPQPEPVVESPAPAPPPAPEPVRLGAEPRVALVGTPYTYNPGYHGSWSRRVLGGRPYEEDHVDIAFSGLPVEGAERTWMFTLELLDWKPAAESDLELTALPASTVTVHQTPQGLEVSSQGLSSDLQWIAESMLSDLFVAVPSTPRGVGGTFVSDVVSAPAGIPVEEHTSWTLSDRPADGVLTLEGRWTRRGGPSPGTLGPVATRGARQVGLSKKGVHQSTRHSTVHGDHGSYVEVVRIGTGRRLK